MLQNFQHHLPTQAYKKISVFLLIRILLEINFALSNFRCQNVQTMVIDVFGGGAGGARAPPGIFEGIHPGQVLRSLLVMIP